MLDSFQRIAAVQKCSAKVSAWKIHTNLSIFSEQSQGWLKRKSGFSSIVHEIPLMTKWSAATRGKKKEAPQSNNQQAHSSADISAKSHWGSKDQIVNFLYQPDANFSFLAISCADTGTFIFCVNVLSHTTHFNRHFYSARVSDFFAHAVRVSQLAAKRSSSYWTSALSPRLMAVSLILARREMALLFDSTNLVRQAWLLHYLVHSSYLTYSFIFFSSLACSVHEN